MRLHELLGVWQVDSFCPTYSGRADSTTNNIT